jgi:hypothetical protein
VFDRATFVPFLIYAMAQIAGQMTECDKSAASLLPDGQIESAMIQINIADSAMTNVNC